MAKRYDPIMCMMVDEPTKAHDELSLAQKKQVVTELKGYLKKSYNFSDESEYARAYEDLRHMFNTGSRKSISGLFENTVKKTGAHDAKARDVAPATQRYINTIVDESKANAEKFVRQAEQDDEVPENELKYVYKAYNEKFGYKFHDSASALDKAIKTCDAVDVDRISNYLWLWVEGREVTSVLFNEGLDKYPGPHDKEHKDEAYDFAKKYAQKELDALYSKLKSSVEKKLKEGYTNIKNAISSAK